jgi:FtsH-binding integral membrane protein
MSRKSWGKVGVVVGVLVALLALDVFVSLEGLPVLAALLGFAFLVTNRPRVWLKEHDRAGAALLPFLAAAFVLLLGFTRGRDLSQGVLLLITLALVFDILLAALALIGEASKRGLKGAGEFLGLAGLGLALGLILSLVFLVEMGRLGGTSLAGP